ncbi:MAG: ATP-dependent Clp protease adaptor ClpS [Myxococcaceae bacterium]
MAPKTHSSPDSDTGTVTQTRKKEKLKRPTLYKVLLHNDDYTTMEFVVAVLREVFRRPEEEAIAIMLSVHRTGVGVAGVYTYEIAETKVRMTEQLARENEFPLKLSMEPEEV